MRRTLKAYLAFIYFFTLTVFIILSYKNLFDFKFIEIIFLLFSLLVINNMSMFFNSMTEINTSMNLPVIIVTFFILNPFWAAVISAVGSVEFKFKKYGFVWYKFLFNRSIFFLAAAAGSLVFNFSYAKFNYPKFPFVSVALASLVYFIVNNFLVYLVIRVSERDVNNISLLSYFKELPKNLITSYFLGLALLSAYIYFGKILFLLVILLLFVIKDFFYSRLQQLNFYTQIIESFLKVIDSKDHYTEGHCERVAGCAYHLCREMELSRARAEKIVSIAKIHDIGKIYVDDNILTSSENLTDSEYEEIKRHSEYGYRLLKDIDILKDELKIILYHHERYDGKGYPEGIKAEAIPIGARILNVCDSFDVMLTGRSYKPPMTKLEIITELEECSGSQFDPEIASKMIKLINDGYFDDKFKSKEVIKELALSFEY